MRTGCSYYILYRGSRVALDSSTIPTHVAPMACFGIELHTLTHLILNHTSLLLPHRVIYDWVH